MSADETERLLMGLIDPLYPYKLANGCHDQDERNFGKIKEGTHYSDLLAVARRAFEMGAETHDDTQDQRTG